MVHNWSTIGQGASVRTYRRDVAAFSGKKDAACLCFRLIVEPTVFMTSLTTTFFFTDGVGIS